MILSNNAAEQEVVAYLVSPFLRSAFSANLPKKAESPANVVNLDGSRLPIMIDSFSSDPP